MSRPGDRVDQAIRAIDEPPAQDTAVAAVAAITSMVPLFGGVLAAALTEWRQHLATERLVAVLEELRDAIGQVREHIDRPFAADPEFKRTLDWAIESATQARHAAKRRYYAAAVARTALPDRPDELRRQVLLDTLDSLQPAHLAILRAVADDPAPPSEASRYQEPRHRANERMRQAVPKIGADVLARCWEDLASMQLVASVSTLTVDYGLARPIGVPQPPIITDFGRRFLRFVTVP